MNTHNPSTSTHKSLLAAFLCLFLGLPTVQAQVAGFGRIDSCRIYIDAMDTTFYQSSLDTAFTWPDTTDKLYAVFTNDSLLIDTSYTELEKYNFTYSGSYQYTVNALAPVSDGRADLTLLYYRYQFGDNYGVVQFTTYSQNGTTDPNQLDSQTNHFEVKDSTIFKMTYKKEPCNDVAKQLILNW